MSLASTSSTESIQATGPDQTFTACKVDRTASLLSNCPQLHVCFSGLWLVCIGTASFQSTLWKTGGSKQSKLVMNLILQLEEESSRKKYEYIAESKLSKGKTVQPHLVCKLRMALRAVSGESFSEPGAFLTGANSSSRFTSSSATRCAHEKVSKMKSSSFMPCPSKNDGHSESGGIHACMPGHLRSGTAHLRTPAPVDLRGGRVLNCRACLSAALKASVKNQELQISEVWPGMQMCEARLHLHRTVDGGYLLASNVVLPLGLQPPRSRLQEISREIMHAHIAPIVFQLPLTCTYREAPSQ
jgi:hypothetical protein